MLTNFYKLTVKKVVCFIAFNMAPKEKKMYTKTVINSIALGSNGIDVNGERKGSR